MACCKGLIWTNVVYCDLDAREYISAKFVSQNTTTAIQENPCEIVVCQMSTLFCGPNAQFQLWNGAAQCAVFDCITFYTLQSEQNKPYSVDDILKCMFLKDLGCNFDWEFFKYFLQDLIDEKPTLFRLMTTPSHCLKQYSRSFITPYNDTRSQLITGKNDKLSKILHVRLQNITLNDKIKYAESIWPSLLTQSPAF